ncbi:nucleoside hydrolase [Erythrobacter arachoides]|uniref:Nucleoside hydrolase n=1 Tax=Aurantiacibacter arachoides TaxID=1850444 RepID=A0A844ZY30_9SPHN|nr:nucleoside hydrolase [Aurantiacibacter arachoides]MXO92628.1 nucleoside hydrolase [Aurantiacibacter arachoides]
MDRRDFVSGAAAALALLSVSARPVSASAAPLARVICDNDFAGDPDGLFQLAQQVLSPSIDISLIVGSHLHEAGLLGGQSTASDGAASAQALLRVMRQEDRFGVLAGSETAIESREEWQASPATAAIVAEAMREDLAGTFLYCAGASLTELALAWLAEPRIGPRTRLIWIGGNEHPGLGYPPPNADPMEFNFGLDPVAAQVIFNESDIEIWQVPRNAYRQLIVSASELAELAAGGPIGSYLVGKLGELHEMVERLLQRTFPRTETYIMGDSPLITLSALQTFFQTDPASSEYVLKPTPILNADGTYNDNPAGRPMRAFTSIDTRLTLADMMAKIRAADRALLAG